jgi:hypothetical protein
MPPIPGTSEGVVAVPPPCSEPGCWAGAPSAVVVDGVTWLAYRAREPVERSRRADTVLARSDDGERFETVFVLGSERFGAQSLERPALVVTPDGRWRLYLCCATPNSKHWWIDLLEAAAPEDLAEAEARTVLPGDEQTGVKDPVIRLADGLWHGWICCHPLDEVDEEDRMVTRYATSGDGVAWTWRGDALAGRPGRWDSRGARVTAVLLDESPAVAYYDGRATKEENFRERTGIAIGAGEGVFSADGDAPVAAARYLDVVPLPGGGYRLFYEAPRPDGAHELRTELAPS